MTLFIPTGGRHQLPNYTARPCLENGRATMKQIVVVRTELELSTFGLQMGLQRMRVVGLRVASCELRVASCELRVASCELRVASCELRVASCELRVAVAVASCSCELRCSCELQTDKIKIFLILDKVR